MCFLLGGYMSIHDFLFQEVSAPVAIVFCLLGFFVPLFFF